MKWVLSIYRKLYDSPSSLFAKGWKYLFLPFSLLFRALIFLRNWTYDKSLFSRYTSPIPIISIGNLTAGGTGKTPFTLFLIEACQHSLRVAVLSRGYQGTAECLPSSHRINYGEGAIFSSSFCGDEPYLLANRAPKTICYVGENRVASAKMAEKEGVQLILLEDGFQHRKLLRDIDIVILNAQSPFHNGTCFPSGLLRESPSSLKRAKLIVAHAPTNDQNLQILEEELHPFTTAPMIGTRVKSLGFFDQKKPYYIPQKSEVLLFSAIGSPLGFEKSVKDQGLKVSGHIKKMDHQSFSLQELEKIKEKARELNIKYLICTEKDWVKLPHSLLENLDFPAFFYLKISLEIVYGKQVWDLFLKEVVTHCSHKEN